MSSAASGSVDGSIVVWAAFHAASYHGCVASKLSFRSGMIAGAQTFHSLPTRATSRIVAPMSRQLFQSCRARPCLLRLPIERNLCVRLTHIEGSTE